MNNKRWNFDMVGVLTDEYIFHEKFGRQSIFKNHLNVIQFNLRMISRPPADFPSVEFFTGFSHDLEEWGFEDIGYLRDDERVESLRQFLDDSLIVFRPERRVLHENKTVYVAQHIRVMPKVESYQPSDVLIPLPVFSEAKHGYGYEEFLFRLKTGKYLGRLDHLSHHPEDTPPYILWKDGRDEYHLFGRFNKHTHAFGGFKFIVSEPLRTIVLDEEWINHCYDRDHIQYVPLDVVKRYDEKLAKVAPIQIQKQGGEIPPTVETQVEMLQEEKDLLNRLIEVTREQGLFYEEKDLYNFHTAMKASGFVVLAGMSGTGKSRLVQAYAKALGLFESQLTMISVRPSWTDDADLLGYPDTLHHLYRPGDTQFINTLIEAEKEENQDKLYMICFDEMNLSRVEHYFSQALSILEREESHRELRLYNDDLVDELGNSSYYKPSITVGDNVLFVGTVNMDESTHHFSDKFLDRANLIELKIMPFHVLKTNFDENHTLRARQTIDFANYEKMRNTERAIQLTDEELTFLWTLHEDMQRLSRHLGIGPRIIRQIDSYLKNLPPSSVMTRADGFDSQVVQRILPKVRGTEGLLGAYFGARADHNSGFVQLLERFQHLSHFKETLKVAEQKRIELRENGYTI